MPAAQYRKLTIITWVFAVVAMGVILGPNAWSGSSWDPDDFMRIVQVRDLLQGQAWSDLTQYRLNPPNGTLMHWSRLPDVPIALVTLALSPIVGERDAIVVAAMLLPPLYLLFFLGLFAPAARLMLGPARSPAAMLMAIGGSLGTIQFAPGHVDHHGLQLVAMMAALTFLLLGLARPRWGRAITWAGLPFALSIWIGAETLPLIATWFAALGLAWCYAGGKLAKYGAIAGLLGAMCGMLILLTSQPRALWFSPVCDALSMMPIGMLALIGVGFAGMAILGRQARSPLTRLIIAAACGAAVGVAFALAFPACLGGGLEAVDPVVKLHWLSHVSEAMSWPDQLAAAPFQGLMVIWPPLLGLGYCLWRLRRARKRGRMLWGATAVLVLGTSALLLWQVRAVSFAHAMALLPLSGLVGEPLSYVWRKWTRLARYAAAPLLFFVCSLLFWPSIQVAYGAIAGKRANAPPPLFLAPKHCERSAALTPLQDAAPTVVLSYIDIGSMILYRTPHSVLGAPYHRDNEGLRATIDLFRSNDDTWIRNKLKEFAVGWIVTCPAAELNVYNTADHDGLAERLSSGQVPNYLEEITDPEQSGMRFYRVRAGE